MKYTFYILSFLLLLPLTAFSQEAGSIENNVAGQAQAEVPVPAQPEGAAAVNGQQLPVPEQAIEGNVAGTATVQGVESANAPAAASPATNAPSENVIKPYVLFDGKSISGLNTDIKSIMFDRKELPSFYKRVLASRNNKNASLSQTTNIQILDEAGEPVSIVAPSFFLSSILLPSDGNWSIWVNKNKIRNYAPSFDKLEILKVTKTTIDAQFQDNNLMLMTPDIQNKLQLVEDGEWDYVSQKGDIKVNLARGLVNFTIKLNQSFSIYDMEIFEGFVDAKTVSTAPTDGTGVDGAVEPGAQAAEDILQPN